MDKLPIDGVDLDGWPFSVNDWGTMRVSKCCHAAVTYSDETLCCKRCWRDVDPAANATARLDANWQPGDGPYRFTLPTTTSAS